VNNRPVSSRVHGVAPRTPRRAERLPVNVPGRLTWKDARGMPRFASVMTRNVSDEGVYLECRGGEPIPLFRLVYLQLEREGREVAELPSALKDDAFRRTGPAGPSMKMPTCVTSRPPSSAYAPM